jgi:hypothetical protein
MPFKPMINVIKPISKNIGNDAWRIQGRSYLNYWPYRSCKTTLKELMLYCFILLKKHISYYHANSILEDYLWWEWLLYRGTIQIPLFVGGSSVSKACYSNFCRLAHPDGLAHCAWRLSKICHFCENSNEIHHVQFVDGHFPNIEVSISSYKSLTWQVSSKRHISRRALHYHSLGSVSACPEILLRSSWEMFQLPQYTPRSKLPCILESKYIKNVNIFNREYI